MWICYMNKEKFIRTKHKFMAQKFVKATGLHNVFSTSSETTLDITSIKPSV